MTRSKQTNKTQNNAERIAWRRDSEAHKVNSELGVKIRNFRKQAKMSLNAASTLTGIPAATLSRIETNKMSPTFPILIKIMVGLKITWADLTSPSSAREKNSLINVTMPGEAPSNSIEGYKYWAPHADSPFSHLGQPLIFEVSGKTLETSGGLNGHHGVEFCYVLSGTLTLHFEGREPFNIPEGGSAMFSGNIPHSYVSKGRKKTIILNFVMEDPVINSGTTKKPFSVRNL